MDMAWESLAFEAPIFQGGDNPLVWTFKLSGAVATGECRFSLVPSGKLTLSYAFHYRGDPAKVREAGVALSFAKSADRLSWVRRGEWDFYPDDHIGRLRG